MHTRGHFPVASTIVAVGLAFASVGCGGDDDSASTTASLTSDAITVTDLDVTNCDIEGGPGIVLEATKDSFLLQVDAPGGGTGTINYTGGEEDTDALHGSVDRVDVKEDGSFTVEGSWYGHGAYTLTGVAGSCTNL